MGSLLGHALVAVLAAVLLGAPACRRDTAAPGGGGEKRYPVRGTVVQVDFPDSRVVLDHEEIPDYMDAMTMPFAVRDRSLLNGLDAGDVVSATLVVNMRDNRSWLEDLRVVSKGQSIDSPSRTPGRDAKPGEALPDVSLVDQDGRPLRIADYKGKALAFTFIFVRCPLPEFCPRMTSHFAAIEKALVADPALYEKTRLLSISFDTEHDKPAVLRAYGAPFQPAGATAFAHWTLASGSAEEVRRIAEFFQQGYAQLEALAQGSAANNTVQVAGVSVPVEEVVATLRQLLSFDVGDLLTELTHLMFGAFSSLASVAAVVGTASVVAHFFLIDLPISGGTMTTTIPAAYRREIALLFGKLDVLWLRFFRALIIIGVITGAASLGLFVLFGIDGALILAVVTAAIGLIPVVGRILALIMIFGAALINGSTRFTGMDNLAFAVLTFVLGPSLLTTNSIQNKGESEASPGPPAPWRNSTI